MPYNPRDCGALCDECPLGPEGEMRGDTRWRPVGPELHDGATIIAVAESPGPDEVEIGRPLVGRSGSEWNEGLSAIGRTRPQVDLTNVICCKPPGPASGAWLQMTRKLDRLNKPRSRDGLEPLPHPATCCRPRLLQEVAEYPNIISLGKTATQALTGLASSILATRGGPLRITDEWAVTQAPDETAYRLLPTVHPAFVLRAPSWRQAFHADLGKAFRWFADELRWTKPETLWRPDAATLQQWLMKQKANIPSAPFYVYDVETDGIEPMTAKLRCLAITVPDLRLDGKPARPDDRITQVARAVAVSLLSTDGSTRFYEREEEAAVRKVLCDFFTNPDLIKVGHNAGSYDRMVVEAQLGVTPYPLVDTLFSARFRAPDLPKGLKTIGSIITDVERWETTEKGHKISTGSQDDDELLRYNIVDTLVNARITAPLIDAAAAQGAFRALPDWARPANWRPKRPFDLHEVDHATQDMCVGLHKNGIWIDQARRIELEVHFTASVKRREKRIKELASEEGVNLTDSAGFDEDQSINPGSYDQVRYLLYSRWALSIPPHMEARDFYTMSGLPGSNDAVLRAHLASGNLNPLQDEFIRELRLYRREKNKILGTVLHRLRFRSQDRKVKGDVWPDGRLRPNWNAHVTSVGRLSCSNPNVQNIGNRKGQGPLKTVFSAPPGRLLIGADLDQAHLRIIANYWKIPLLVEAFDEGVDPHNTLAYATFGKAFSGADGWGPEGFDLKRKPPKGKAKSMRDIAKTLRYASIYGANPTTVWQVITSTETDDAELPYLGMTVREVRLMHSAWLKSEPEWEQAWKAMQARYDRQGFMEEPLFRRRSGPLSDGKMQEVVNFPILACESSLMRIAEQQVLQAFPFGFAGPGTGMIQQVHDSIVVEVPAGQAEQAAQTLAEAMTLHIPGWSIPVTAESAYGRTLKEV